MFRNPVYDMVVVVPALLIAGLIGFLVMTTQARAATIGDDATTTGSRALIASTSGTTFPDASENVITITRGDSAYASLASTTPVPANALAVRSGADLLAYAHNILMSDPYIASITLSTQGVTVMYRRQGRLLGLLPMPVPRTVLVRTDGSVSFTEPWYGAASWSDQDRVRTALEVRVHALLTSEDYLSSMKLAPATQAEILDIIRELLA